jgi:hypothetical protein
MSAIPAVRKHVPKNATWPYSPADFERYNPTPDPEFYENPRLVTHIDDFAIDTLRTYYSDVLPKQGRILDFCSSWISHYPGPIENAAKNGEVEVIGMGMNKRELDANPILGKRIVQDLNIDPTIPHLGDIDAATCVVSIDYLTQPLLVLSSLRQRLSAGAMVHLVISNRCFPTKVVKRWLDLSEEKRLEMVGDYLHFAGYDDVEILTLSDGWAEVPEGHPRHGQRMRVDPLWVVRATAGPK